MKTTKEMISIMQDYANGKEIELCALGGNRWCLAITPMWNWVEYDYRVKQESRNKYRPYANADECFADIKKHGGWVKNTTGQYINISAVGESAVSYASDRTFSYESTYRHWVWADDGSVCGVKEE